MPIKFNMNLKQKGFTFAAVTALALLFTLIPILRQDTQYVVTRVIDGDTIKVFYEGEEKSVRLIGIDTPETYRKKECYGEEATEKLEDLLSDSNGGYVPVSLKKDDTQSNFDVYGRLVRYVEFKGHDAGLLMIRSGHAAEYTYNDPYLRIEEYKKAQMIAQRNLIGLHGVCHEA